MRPSRRQGRPAALVLAAALTALAAPAQAEDAPAAPRVRFLRTELATVQPSHVVVRGAFEIAGPPHRWYGVGFRLLLDKGMPLLNSEGTVRRRWNDLFTPDNVRTARWTDIRVAIPRQAIASAENLPQGRRAILWAAAEVKDYATGKYLGSPWSVAAPLIVTRDEQGQITGLAAFDTEPFAAKPNPPSESLRGRRCRLKCRHLEPRDGVRLYRAVDREGGAACDLLVGPKRHARLAGTSRGQFFRPIDSPQKARELALLDLGGSVVIETQEQYRALVSAAKSVGYETGPHIRAQGPPSAGVRVRPEPDLGYRVSALVLRRDGGSFGAVVRRRIAVGTSGRIGIVERTYIDAPSLLPGRDGQAPSKPEAYSRAIEAALDRSATASVADPVEVTDEAATILRPAYHPSAARSEPAPLASEAAP